jgi:hypothetical protein
MSYFSLKSCLITPPPNSSRRCGGLARTLPSLTCHRVVLAFAPPSHLPWLAVVSCCTILIALLPLNAQPSPPASHWPLVLPGWFLRHFSLRRFRLTLPLFAPPPLIDVPAGCCLASHCAASALHQLSSCRRLLHRAGWLLRCLSSCHPLVRVGEGQLTIRLRQHSSKGQLTVLRCHCGYPLVRCCHCRHCTSRVSPMAPRCHPHPCVNKGWPTMPRCLVIITRPGATDSAEALSYRPPPMSSLCKGRMTANAKVPPPVPAAVASLIRVFFLAASLALASLLLVSLLWLGVFDAARMMLVAIMLSYDVGNTNNH